ncbi:DUF3619 family protein [Pseudoroseicyclus sp. CXY001]|uniref:DUF3619 family protein n=1 Tax=Pseudoroseicyclus sp. CXY001 TaxID=3242492 RepID=UPI00357130E5
MPKDDDLSPHEIERRIERERSELSATLAEIQHRFTPEALIGEVTRSIRTNGEEVGRAVTRQVKDNPVALAVTGIGLAWLIFGRGQKSSPDYTPGYVSEPPRGAAGGDPRAERLRDAAAKSWTPSAASAAGRPADDRGAHYPSWYADDGELDALEEELARDAEATGEFSEFSHAHEAVVERDGKRERVAGAASAAGDTVRDAAGSVGDAARGAADSVGDAADGARARLGAGADRVRDAASRARMSVSDALYSGGERARRLRDRLAEGTEDLSHEARERIIHARARALDARRQAGTAARNSLAYGRDAAIRGKDRAVDFFEEQPLVAGALALAVGAAIAGALPRSRKEDEWFGETSDHLRHEAERIFREERAKAERVARAALDEANSVVREEAGKADHAAKEAIDAGIAEARDAAHRVEERARTEAEREKLGQPDV